MLTNGGLMISLAKDILYSQHYWPSSKTESVEVLVTFLLCWKLSNFEDEVLFKGERRWCVVGTQLGTPRGRYDEHSSKFPSVMKPRFIELVGKRTNFRRLMLTGLATAPNNLYMVPYLGRSFTPAATWNLHTTQPKYFAPTSSEVVNLTGFL
jgi:hypothetical protein